MRAVMVMFDTLTRSFLPNYGNDWVQMPNFQRLQKHCTVFDEFYAGSMPCMPARRELHTGNYNFMHRRWGPLEPFDFSVFEKLQEEGIYTHLITDHSHYFEDGGATYHNRYSTWEGFRGQEGDRWMPRLNVPEPLNRHPLNKTGISVIQHQANKAGQQQEEEMSSVRTIQRGIDFLRKCGQNDNWFLQIECFDPHEPFYVPEKYRRLYQGIDGPDIPNWPGYQRLDWRENEAAGAGSLVHRPAESLSDSPTHGPTYGPATHDIANMRNEYAALLTMCDHHLGRILDVMDEQNMWEDTLLIVNTDHGFLLGEHNYLGKNISPAYDELVHLPFFIHLPGLCAGENKNGGNSMIQRSSALAQTIDIPATLLDYFNIQAAAGKDGANMDGKSLLPVLRGETEHHHDTILYGINGGHANIYDSRYVYMRASADESNGPYVNYTMMPTEMRGFYPKQSLKQIRLSAGSRYTNGMPCIRVPLENQYDSYKMGNLLYDMQSDPQQLNPITDPELETMMTNKLKAAMDHITAPPEEYQRLGLINNN